MEKKKQKAKRKEAKLGHVRAEVPGKARKRSLSDSRKTTFFSLVPPIAAASPFRPFFFFLPLPASFPPSRRHTLPPPSRPDRHTVKSHLYISSLPSLPLFDPLSSPPSLLFSLLSSSDQNQIIIRRDSCHTLQITST